MSKLILCQSCGLTLAGDPKTYNDAQIVYDMCDTCYYRMRLDEEKRLKLYYETRGDQVEADAKLLEILKDKKADEPIEKYLEKWLDGDLKQYTDLNPANDLNDLTSINDLSKEETPFD